MTETLDQPMMRMQVRLPAPIVPTSVVMLAIGSIWPSAVCGPDGLMEFPEALPPIPEVAARLRTLADDLESEADMYDPPSADDDEEAQA